MRRGLRAIGALGLTAVAIIGTLVVRERTKIVLDDFEGPFRLYDWAFEPGLPGQGASGAFVRSARAARSGRMGGELRFDFSRGGTYVQATLPTRWIGSTGGVSLWVRGSAGTLLAVRVRDQSDQVFQREIGFAPREWTRFTVPFADWTDSYGARGDGIMRGAPRAVALVVANTAPQRVGTLHFDEVRRLPQRVREAPWYANLGPHPRLLVSKADLVRRRDVIGSTPWLQRLLKTNLAELHGEHRKGVRIPASTGQCEHWYACPNHGAGLRMEGPRRHVCPIDGRVFSGWPYDDVWTTKQHKRLSKLSRQAAIVYALTDDPAALSVAWSIVTGYAERYKAYPLHDIHGKPGRGGKVLSQSLDDAAWLVPILQAADLIWTDLTERERELIVTDLIGPAINEVIRPNRLRFHNIQCWHNAAIGLAGLISGDRELIAEAHDGARGFDAQVRNMVDQDGMWAEGSWGYHYYALDALWALAQAAATCGHRAPFGQLRPMFLAPVRCAMPNGTLPRFNDDTGTDPATKPIYEAALAELGDPEFAGPLGRSDRDSIHALLYGSPDLPPARPVRGPRLLPDSGYAILASRPNDAAWVCLKYGRPGGDHAHADKNSIVAYAHGEVVLDDPGIGAYLTGLADGWFKTTPAHNAACANGAGQRTAVGSLVAFAEFDEGSAALADAGYALGNVRHRRAVFLIGDHTLVTADTLTSRNDGPNVSDVFWHPAGRWLSKPTGTPLKLSREPGYAYQRDMRAMPLPSTGRSLQFAGPRADGPSRWMSVASIASKASVVVGTGPGPDTAHRVPVAMVRLAGVETTLVTAITLKPAVHPVRIAIQRSKTTAGGGVADPTFIAAEITRGPGRWLVVANPDRRPVHLAGWTGTDALVLKRVTAQ